MATAVVVALPVLASFVLTEVRAVLWLLSWWTGLPARYGADLWRLVPGHFAERHNLIIIDAVWTLAILNVLLWSMIAFETIWVYNTDNRFRLRHDLDADIPTRRPPTRS